MVDKFVCIICGVPATTKISVNMGSDFLLSCSDENCKRVIRSQIQGALKNQN